MRKQYPVIFRVQIQCVEAPDDLLKVQIQFIHFLRAGAQKTEEREGCFQPCAPADSSFHTGTDSPVFYSHHLLPDRNQAAAERQKEQYVVPVADAVINASVCRIHHMPQSVVDLADAARFAGETEQQVFKNLIVGFLNETLSQRQGDAGIAFHDIAVVQNNDRCVIM